MVERQYQFKTYYASTDKHKLNTGRPNQNTAKRTAGEVEPSDSDADSDLDLENNKATPCSVELPIMNDDLNLDLSNSE